MGPLYAQNCTKSSSRGLIWKLTSCSLRWDHWKCPCDSFLTFTGTMKPRKVGKRRNGLIHIIIFDPKEFFGATNSCSTRFSEVFCPRKVGWKAGRNLGRWSFRWIPVNTSEYQENDRRLTGVATGWKIIRIGSNLVHSLKRGSPSRIWRLFRGSCKYMATGTSALTDHSENSNIFHFGTAQAAGNAHWTMQPSPIDAECHG